MALYTHKYIRRQLERRADPSACSNFYISPTMGQVVNALDPLTVTWNSTCLSVQLIDIYLYSPGAAVPRIHVWENVALSRGTYNATLNPAWWNSTHSQNLQVSVVPSGVLPFLSPLPGGPVFNATYTPSSSGTASTSQVGSGITQVNDLAPKKGLTPGEKAAAAILTILVVVALCVAAYVKFKRAKGKMERKRWTEAVDKRMSTISTDWKSVSAAGANAAIRNSIAVGSRSSSFSFGAIRPSSTFAVEGEEEEKRSISQMRTGVGLRHPAASISTERVSRVSFAPDTRISRASAADSRPSGESRRTRAFHTAYVPPVPSLHDTDAVDDSDPGSLSPRQSQGPLTLTADDIRAKIVTTKRSQNELDEVMPALRMMRTGGDPLAPDDLLLENPNPPVAAVVTPAPQPTTSPVIPDMPMEPIPANVMSPDEMLRAYAERKKSTSTAPTINYPKAVAKKTSVRSSNNTMRILYHPTNDDIYGGVSSEKTENVAGVGVGVGNHPLSYHPNVSITDHAIGNDEDDAGIAGRGTGVGALYMAQ